MSTEWVINTRPAPLLETTNSIIAKHGFKPVSLPLIEIEELSPPSDLYSSVSLQSHVAVFTSQFAAKSFFKRFTLSDNAHCIAVGKKTASSIESYSDAMIWTPDKQNSDGVIELLQGMNNFHSVVIVGGQGGRTEIQDWCINERISFCKIEVYKRFFIELSQDSLRKIQKLANPAFLMTSVSSLSSLLEGFKLQNLPWIQNQKLVCASNRIAEAAKKLGFQVVLNARTADIDEMMVYLKQSESLI